MTRGQTNPEILIIGGGIIGLSIARALHKKGILSITVVDQGICGREASWAAAGMLTPQSEADEQSPFFDLCCESRDLYPNFAAELNEETGIDVELDRTGTLAVAFDEHEARKLGARHSRQREAGLAVDHLSREELLRREPALSDEVLGGLFFANDWQVENRRMIKALRRYAELNGVKLVQNTYAEQLLTDGSSVVGVRTAGGSMHPGRVILTTGAWTSLIKVGDAALPMVVEPVRGQIVVFDAGERKLKHVVHGPRGYVVPRRDGRVLVGSTTEHVGFDKSVTKDAFDSLAKTAREMLPFLDSVSVADHWSGLRPFASDGLPVLGSLPGVEGLFLATGHYRNGILLAPLTANLVAEEIVEGSRSPYVEHFGVGRFLQRRAGIGQ